MGVRVLDRVHGMEEDILGKFARSVHLSVLDGNLQRAHHLLDLFASKIRRVGRPLLEPGDSVAQLIDPETAGLLQEAGYHNIASVLYASDADLLSIYMFGKGRLRKTRAALVEHNFTGGNSQTAVLRAC